MTDAKSYKPFDLEAALRGEKVLVVRDYYNGPLTAEVQELARFSSGSIAVRVDKCEGFAAQTFTMNADGSDPEPVNAWKLVMAPKMKKVKLWVNVYLHSDGDFECGSTFEAKEIAAARVSPANQYIATVPIELEVAEYRGSRWPIR